MYITGGSTAGTEYTEGDTDASITGTAILWEDAANTLVVPSSTKPLPVDIKNTAVTVDLGTNNDVTVTSGTITSITNSVSTTLPSEALRVDDTTTPNVTYVGYGAMGAATGDSVWKMKKIDTSSGVVITWADGDASYNNEWDNRATTVVYS